MLHKFRKELHHSHIRKVKWRKTGVGRENKEAESAELVKLALTEPTCMLHTECTLKS